MSLENYAEGCILVEQEDGIMTVVFNRPQKKNALTHAMYDAMITALQQAESEPSVRLLCFKGTAGCFTSGNDLKDSGKSSVGRASPVMRFPCPD